MYAHTRVLHFPCAPCVRHPLTENYLCVFALRAHNATVQFAGNGFSHKARTAYHLYMLVVVALSHYSACFAPQRMKGKAHVAYCAIMLKTLAQLNVAPSRASNGNFRNRAQTQHTVRRIERDCHIPRHFPHEGEPHLRTDDIIAPSMPPARKIFDGNAITR